MLSLINSSISYFELVLYIQEFAKISLYELPLSSITSPKFFTDISSPTLTFIFSDICTKFDNTPVILNSTFLEMFPSSYP